MAVLKAAKTLDTCLKDWVPVRRNCSTKLTIIKFVCRKTAEDILRKREKFKDVDYTNIGIAEDTKIFAILNLSPAFKEPDYFCRMLKKDGLITNVDTSNRHVKIKHGDRYVKVGHVGDLRRIFKDREFKSRSYEIVLRWSWTNVRLVTKKQFRSFCHYTCRFLLLLTIFIFLPLVHFFTTRCKAISRIPYN